MGGTERERVVQSRLGHFGTVASGLAILLAGCAQSSGPAPDRGLPSGDAAAEAGRGDGGGSDGAAPEAGPDADASRPPDGGGCLPMPESCNGLDDDCDGATDEDISMPCSSACGEGIRSCSAGAWGDCSAPAPEPEACNGLDDDCDGLTDEDLVQPCGSSCGSGVRRCVDGAWGTCDATAPTPELCNGLDDDCDGLTDEDLSMACSSACGEGARSCSAGAWGDCSAPAPEPEACNGLDDDCDGLTDEDFRARTEATTYTHLAGHLGECDGTRQRWGDRCNAAIHRHCRDEVGCTNTGFGPVENLGDDAYLVCVAATVYSDVPYATLAAQHPGCDGTAEQFGLACNAAIHRYCGSRGHASGFGPVEHVGGMVATVACLDGDQVRVLDTTYTALASFHAGCDGTTRQGPDCSAAIKRFCVERGHLSGFGPVENNGDRAWVACVLRP